MGFPAAKPNKISILGADGEVVPFATQELQQTQIDNQAAIIVENTDTGSKELRVFQENHVCADNTTTTLLGAGGIFTGVWQDCLNYQEVNISVDTDKNSATNGLVIEWSADGINVADNDTFSVYANAGTNYTPNPAFRYVRVKYTNGTTPQTRFNLMTILRRGATGGSFHRIDSTLKDDSDARLNITVPKLKTAANTYVSQQATTAGNAKVSIEEFEDQISVNNNTQLKTTSFDILGNEIDFATEAKQDTQILNETTLISLIETVQELSSRLAFLNGVRGSVSDLRVTPISLPTLGTVTTVATLTNQTNIGGFSAAPMVGATQNAIAIQSNINNVTA